ncbi:thioesterase family protein [Oscillatoria sp. CS-180]|uniref:acyl-CoA thioesterase n=1 Tax=Oscillatoria sp. CS-180 TaxID=3021720 RepID=UPI00232C90CC|nr:thioesterase family protein [Oscillatoria sp. CS-180]MDB9528518.1 thioesterase family protein [Oscillatoria sp. CS-180]
MSEPAIAPESAFEYPIHVYPHHTDYAGIVWHGTYINWMEEARVACLQSQGVNFADWIEAGVDLPVVDLSVRYRRSLVMGVDAIVKAWAVPQKSVRIVWQYDIQEQTTRESCVIGTVTLAPIDRASRRVLRRLPEPMKSDLARLYGGG